MVRFLSCVFLVDFREILIEGDLSKRIRKMKKMREMRRKTVFKVSLFGAINFLRTSLLDGSDWLGFGEVNLCC